jgi:SAM-dependent methyltransferase
MDRTRQPAANSEVLARLGFSSYDLAARDKIPVIRDLMAADELGSTLDIGIGTGYTTHSVFGDRPTVCVDLDPGNLRYYRDHVRSVRGLAAPLCVAAEATALPFKCGTFRFVLCSEVLEHLENDGAATRELSRVLAANGRAVITVPYSGAGFTSFLELVGIKTVHDFPGPEYHVRSGYDEHSLSALLSRHGLRIICHAYYFRFFTRLTADFVSLAHLLYQRVVHRRRAWTWSDAATAEESLAFKLYGRLFPLLLAFCRLDRLLRRRRGFGLVVAVVKERIS